jgi:2-dehydro-3-deoxyphosphogluconate aldolase / (4S)-4-hydroxy-2-oxoglutarate aldolase
MGRTAFSWADFYSMPVVGIMRNISPDDAVHILPIYHTSGLTTIEITLNSLGWEESIQYALQHYEGKLNIGVGTVCTEEDLNKALKAGAQFIVTPVINFEVINVCKQAGVPIFVGAYTPTEIFNAWNAGADMVKVFPAISNGKEYISAIKGPLPQIKLLPTGGINLENCTEFLKVGVNGLGIGSELFNKAHIKSRKWTELSDHFALFVNKIKGSIS